MILHDADYYARRKPQPDLGPLQNFKRFVWDPERRAFLDRTWQEWVKVGIFYSFFFGVVFSLFALKMWLVLSHISNLERPYLQYRSLATEEFSELEKIPHFRAPFSEMHSPGIGFKPNILTPATSPIIWVSSSSEKARPARYIKELDDVLREYDENVANFDPNCTEGRFRDNFVGKSCFFNVSKLGVCGHAPYGYTVPLQPCVLVKINRMFDWMPRYYDRTAKLPQKMPEFLKTIIRSSAEESYVWLSCVGADNVDEEHIGEMEYLPGPGFPIQFFPYVGQPRYLSPIVALRFKNLTGTWRSTRLATFLNRVDRDE